MLDYGLRLCVCEIIKKRMLISWGDMAKVLVVLGIGGKTLTPKISIPYYVLVFSCSTSISDISPGTWDDYKNLGNDGMVWGYKKSVNKDADPIRGHGWS